MSAQKKFLPIWAFCLSLVMPCAANAGAANPQPGVPPTAGFLESEVKFASGNVVLAGTLLMPTSPGSHPAVVLVHGDRPGERAAYRRYGQPFAENGIAALIFDRRGSGSSGGEWLGASFEDFADDALAAVRFLCARQDVAPSMVGLWGISQGAWVIAIAAARSPEVGFIISVSGAGMSPAAQAVWLYRNALHARKTPSGLQAQGEQSLRLFFNAMDWARRSGPESVRRALPGFDLYHDPVPILERVRQPVLAIYGAADTSVPPRASAETFWAALGRARNRAITLLIFPEADHMLMQVGQPTNALTPGFLEAMTGWVHALKNGMQPTTLSVGRTLKPAELPPEKVPAGRPGWFGSFPVHSLLVVFFATAFASAVCFPLIRLLARSIRRRPSAGNGMRAMVGMVVCLGVVNLVLLWGLVRLVAGHAAFIVAGRFSDQTSLWTALVDLSWVSVGLTFGLVVILRRSWLWAREGRPGRVAFPLFLGLALLWVPFLASWHMLGF